MTLNSRWCSIGCRAATIDIDNVDNYILLYLEFTFIYVGVIPFKNLEKSILDPCSYLKLSSASSICVTFVTVRLKKLV